jgi:16S rRNA processing protein RimM
LSEVEIGRVVKAHGIRGEVGVLLHREESDLLERIQAATLVRTDGTSVLTRIERVSRMGRGFRVKFLGYNDRDAAEQIRGAVLFVPREVLPPLSADESYLIDLVGASVVGPDGVSVGRVIAVQSYPSVDSVVIERPDGSTVEQPLVDNWVSSVDVKQCQIQLSSLEGLL